MALTTGLHQSALHQLTHEQPNITEAKLCYEKREPLYKQAKPKRIIPASSVEVDSVLSVDVCTTHLLLLEAFYYLRASVLISEELDSILGIVPHRRRVQRGHRTVYLGDTTFEDRRKEKWPFFLRISVARFKLWHKEADAVLKNHACPDLDPNATAKILATVLPPLGMSSISL